MTPIAFGLCATLGWGASNFLGGYASRTTNPFSLSAVAHLLGMGLTILVATTMHSPVPSRHALVWAFVAGLAGGLALAILYRALSTGKVGLAASVAAVLSSGIPAIVTIFREGWPGGLRLAGFALGTTGLWTLSRSQDRTEARVLAMAILAGCGFALYALAIKAAGGGSPMWIDVHSRMGALLVTTTVALSSAGLREFRLRTVLWASAVGSLDAVGSVAFVRATQLARLDTVVMLASLYPAITVALGAIFLKEKLSRRKLAGLYAALLSLPLIAR